MRAAQSGEMHHNDTNNDGGVKQIDDNLVAFDRVLCPRIYEGIQLIVENLMNHDGCFVCETMTAKLYIIFKKQNTLLDYF